MLGIILAAVGLLICVYIGLAVDNYYKSRLNTVRDYLAFVRYSERETEFLKTDMPALLSGFECKSEFKKMITEASGKLSEGGTAECASDRLKKEDLEKVNAFLKGLSETDYVSRAALFRYSISIAENMEKVAEKEKKQKGELIKKLMFLLGVGLVILAI